ncbi:hypothetical protein KC353_g70 [Hortaea werneckii]|nr:hypothetical protein KC353_g70 [Hortaea werneckii]
MGTRTAELCQLYLLPPQLIPTRNKVELTIIDADPIQSKERSFSRIGADCTERKVDVEYPSQALALASESKLLFG